MLEPSRAVDALGADVVVGVPVERDRTAAAEAAVAVQAGLREVLPGRPAVALVLAADTDGTVPPGAPITIPEPGGPSPAVNTGGHASPEASLHALLQVAVSLGAPACALLQPLPRPVDPGWLHAVLDPVLHEDTDLVAPSYARGRFEGVLIAGLVYPLTRALFGQRIRQPLGRELAMSRRLVEHLTHDDEWQTDPAYAGADLWVITKALVRECRCAQVFLGPRPVPRPQPPDLADALAEVVGTLVHEMTLHAPRWQRVRGSCEVKTSGEEYLPDDGASPPPTAPLVEAFALGAQDLRRVWGPVLPPQALWELSRLPCDPPGSFRLPDRLWARIVYDFAVGWRMKAMDRTQLLRSMAPLYLGWVASYVNDVSPLDAAGAAERIERLCEAFEAEKPYLISRWRWPDRFAP